MKKYYTRVCNFTYGNKSIKLVNKKTNLSLNGNKEFVPYLRKILESYNNG